MWENFVWVPDSSRLLSVWHFCPRAVFKQCPAFLAIKFSIHLHMVPYEERGRAKWKSFSHLITCQRWNHQDKANSDFHVEQKWRVSPVNFVWFRLLLLIQFIHNNHGLGLFEFSVNYLRLVFSFIKTCKHYQYWNFSFNNLVGEIFKFHDLC